MGNIVFRVDAGVDIGTGHVMRCLVLADLLSDLSNNIHFVCRKQKGHLFKLIEDKGYHVIGLTGPLEKDAEETFVALNNIEVNWLIIDHYQIDINWERQLRNKVNRILVIDDLANRRHECDVLLDQNFNDQIESRYKNLVPKYCKLLLGPTYLLLRPEFMEARNRIKKRDGTVKRLFIFYGGSDPTDETSKALHALQYLDTSNIHVDVVVGGANPVHAKIKALCTNIKASYHCQIDYIAELMAQADLSLGAGGVTMWERCFLELPSIITVVALNQMQSAEAVARLGAVWNLGWHECVTEEKLVDIISEAFLSPEKIIQISQQASRLIDQKNSEIHPVIQIIMGEENDV